MTLLDQLRRSPQLPTLAKDINRILANEAIDRQRSDEDMDENSRWEFINGEVVVHSPAKARHNSTRDRIYDVFKSYVRFNRLGLVSTENWLVALSRNDYEPDIVFWKSAKSVFFKPEQTFFPAPDFVVEVLSPSTEAIDRGVKFDDYAAHGVSEYWIVDPEAEGIEQYRLEGNAFQLVAKSSDAIVICIALDGLKFPVRAAFDDSTNEQLLEAIRPR